MQRDHSRKNKHPWKTFENFLTIVFLLLEVGGSAEIEEVEHLVLQQVRRGPEVPDLQERQELPAKARVAG